MGEEDYKKLYDSVTAQKFDIGTFDEFVVKMQTQEQRRSFYDAMAENKLDLGDYDSYEFRLAGGVKKKDEQLPADPSASVAGGEEVSLALPSISAPDSTASGTLEGGELPAPEVQQPMSAHVPETQFLTGGFGDAINSIPFLGDLIDDSSRAIAQGQRQGNVVNDALSVMTKGRKASDKDIETLISEANAMDKLGSSDEFQRFQKIATEEGGVWGFVKALGSEPQAIGEVFVQSMSSMLNKTTLSVAAPTILTGVAVGGPAGGLATLPYVMAAAGATLETGLTFVDQLKEELEKKELNFDKEGVRSVLEDEEAMSRIRAKALIRGGVIGIVDAFTGRLAVGVGSKIIRKGTKMKTLAVETVIEGVGGGTGEGLATLAIGEVPTVMDVGMEVVGGAPGAGASFLATVARRGKYKVNGQKVDRKTVQALLENSTQQELAGLNIEIENDNDLKDVIKKDQAKAKISETVSMSLSEEDRKKVIELEYELEQQKKKRDTKSKARRIQDITSRIDRIYEREDVKFGILDRYELTEDSSAPAKKTRVSSLTEGKSYTTLGSYINRAVNLTGFGKAGVDGLRDGAISGMLRVIDGDLVVVSHDGKQRYVLGALDGVERDMKGNTIGDNMSEDGAGRNIVDMDAADFFIQEGEAPVSEASQVRGANEGDFVDTQPNAETGVTETADEAPSEVAVQEEGEVAVQQEEEGEGTKVSLEVPEQSLRQRERDRLIRNLQDKYIDIFRLQQAAEKKRGKLDQSQDFEMAETLFYGKSANRIENLEGYADNVVSLMKETGITLEQAEEYAYAMNAKERNAMLLERDGVEDGSGMSDAEADAILDSYSQDETKLGADQKSDMERIHDLFMAITAEDRKLQVESGLMSEEQIAEQERTQPNYVPLMGFATDESPGAETGGGTTYSSGSQGREFDVRGKEGKKAKGRKTRAANVLSQLLTNSAAGRIRAERNIALQKLYNLVEQNPNSDVWTIIKPGQPHDAKRSVGVKINGEQHYVQFKDASLAESLQGMGTERLNAVAKFLRPVNNWLRKSFTSVNPEFIVTNFSRDIQSALVNAVAETDIEGGMISGKSEVVAKIIKRVPQTLRALMRESVTGQSDILIGKYYADFKEDGGKTGWAYSKNLVERRESLEKALSKGDHPFVNKGSEIIGFVEGINDAVENSIRLAAYIEAREAGVSREKAAQLGKNITINFNKQGELTGVLNTLYLFFNASVQGTARLARSMKSEKVQKRMAGVVLISSMLDMVNRGMSDEDPLDGVLWYDKIPSHEKERNFIIMTGGDDYIKIPLPYGWGAIWNMGLSFGGVASGVQTVDEALLFTSSSVLNNLSPLTLGSSSEKEINMLRTIVPTALTSGFDIAVNESFFGGRVRGEQFPVGTEVPESELAYRAPRSAIELGKKVNRATGGTEYRPGWGDFNPDKPWYTAEFFLGGAGKTVTRTAQVAKDLVKGAPIKGKDIPIYRTLSGSVEDYAYYYDVDHYEEYKNEVGQLDKEMRLSDDPRVAGWKKEGKYRGINTLVGALKKAEKELKYIRLKIREAHEMEDYVERLTRVDELQGKIRETMVIFNKAYRDARKEKD